MDQDNCQMEDLYYLRTNHFLTLKIEQEVLKATTYMVCPKVDMKKPKNPRWKANKSMWDTISLECEGKEPDVTIFDQFQIRAKNKEGF